MFNPPWSSASGLAPAAKRVSPPSSKHREDAPQSKVPLQQRSDSEVNVTNAGPPSIRVVADPGSEIYSKSPFPHLPSQILTPRYAPGPTFTSARPGRPVSDENATANVQANGRGREILVPKPLYLRKQGRTSTSTAASEGDTTYGSISPSFSSASSTFAPSEASTAASTFVPDRRDSADSDKLPCLPEEATLADLSLPHDHIDAAQSRRSNTFESTIRLVTPPQANEEHPLTPEQSTSSPTSPGSTPTPTADQIIEPLASSSPNYYVCGFSSSPPTQSSPPAGAPAARESRRPAPFESVESLAFTESSRSTASERPRSSSGPSSVPAHVSTRASVTSVVKLQYPVVRAASTSSSWAEVSHSHLDSPPPSPPPPESHPLDHYSMSDAPPVESEQPYRQQPWSSRLSTIASESDRNSQDGSEFRASPNRQHRRSRTIGSLFSSEEQASSSEAESAPYPAPLFRGPERQPQVYTRGASEEGDDTVGELQPPPLKPQRSGFLSRFGSKSRPGSSDSLRSQYSGISFIGDLSWARSYYRRGETPVGSTPELTLSSGDSRLNTADSSRLDTANSAVTRSPASENFPAAVHRPRNRPRHPHRLRHQESADSLGIEEVEPATRRTRRTRTDSVVTPPTIREMTGAHLYSPHLLRDRRSEMYSVWKAPSFDEPFGNLFFGPVNRQVWLFCIGFVFPLAWALAAILPVPPQPTDPRTEKPGQPVPEDALNASIEDMLDIEQRRHQKARWWRILNRIMIIPGLVIIGAVIALAVVASRIG